MRHTDSRRPATPTGRRSKFFDKRPAARFTNKVTLVRRRLFKALLGGAWVAACASQWGRVTADSPVAHLEPSEAGQPNLTQTEAALTQVPHGESLTHGESGIAAGLSVRAPTDATPSDAPVFSRVILRLRARAQARLLGESHLIEDEKGQIVRAASIHDEDESLEDYDAAPPNAINGNALGHFVPIENEGSLDGFHRALEQLLSRPELKRKVRIVAYGASHTQADIYSGYLRYYLQSRFGNGGVGFVPVGLNRGWSRRLGFKVKTKGFSVQYAQQKPAPRHGRFGLSGAAAVAGPHASVKVSPRDNADRQLAADHYGLFFATEPRGGNLSVKFDNEDPVHLPARSSVPRADYHTFVKPLGWHDVTIRSTGDGAVRLFGLTVEREQPGLVIDTLGIRGTRAANMLQWDQSIWRDQLAHRSPDLVTFAYGTNETTDRGQPMETYARELRQVLGQLRDTLPNVSCVLIGPGDFPRLVGSRWVARPRLLAIIDAQRHIAPEFGCGFWDTYAFMGGHGSMQRWVHARPRLGSVDRIHFTIRGYVRMGMVLGDALMRAYDARHLPAGSRVTAQAQTKADHDTRIAGTPAL